MEEPSVAPRSGAPPRIGNPLLRSQSPIGTPPKPAPHQNSPRSLPALGPPPASLLWLLSLLPSTCLWGWQVLGAPGPAPPHSSPHSPGSVSALSRLHLTSRRLCGLQLSPGLFYLEAHWPRTLTKAKTECPTSPPEPPDLPLPATSRRRLQPSCALPLPP